MNKFALIAALTSAMFGVSASPAHGSRLSRTRTLEGYALAYELRFADCYDALAEAAVADPQDPAPPRAIAGVTWIEILFAQGVTTFEAFTGGVSSGEVARPAAPPMLAARFQHSIDEATALAERQRALADDADANYQIGATAALSALYRATVEGSLLRAFTDGRRAVSAIERARAREPRRRETGLVLGISRYTVSIMSWPVRTLARLSGLSGDREEGLSLLGEAASAGAETETDALLLLMIVDNREGRHEAALQRLARLRRLHPANRLWSLNMGATALAAGRFDQADVFLSEGITARRWISDPAILGETALWFAHRGAARARLLRSVEAIADFERSLASAPRDWVQGRIHSELGDLALAAGDRAAARRHFALAIVFAERGGDRMAEKDCKTKLSRGDARGS